MPEYRDQDFEGKAILLDGSTFTGCTFRNCRLVFEAVAMPEFFANNFKENVQVTLHGNAGATVKFLDMLYHRGGESGKKAVEDVFGEIRRGIFYHDKEGPTQ